MSVTMKPVSFIKARLKVQPRGTAQVFLTATCVKAMDKYIPMDNGDLRSNISLERDSVTYESPYAKYQYYGQREDGTHVVKNYTTPGTGPYWDKRMISAEGDKIMKDLEKFIKIGGHK